MAPNDSDQNRTGSELLESTVSHDYSIIHEKKCHSFSLGSQFKRNKLNPKFILLNQTYCLVYYLRTWLLYTSD